MNVNAFRRLPLFFGSLAFCAASLVSCSHHRAPAPEPKRVVEKRVSISFPVAPPEKSTVEMMQQEISEEREDGRIEEIRRDRVKQRFSLPPVDSVAPLSSETVEIGGKTYTIPAPWAGKKLEPPVFTRDSLVKLPVACVYGGRDVYVKREVRGPLVAMIDAAAVVGVSLLIETAYRDVETQKGIFLRKFREGRTWGDVVRYVAPPGYSEHMLGLAVDFYPSGWKFASTEGYRWLKEHGEEYGFVESYPREPLAGHAKIAWEAWHWLYTGEKKKMFPVVKEPLPVSVDKAVIEEQADGERFFPEAPGR